MRLLPLMLLPVAAITIAAPMPDDRGPGLPGTNQGNATVYRVADFDRVAVGTAGTVDVKVGPRWSLSVTGPAAAFQDLRIVREGDRLEIGRRWRNRPPHPSEQRLRFVITLPRLNEFSLGGSGQVAIDRIQGDAFTANLGGSGNIAIGRMTVNDATISIGGSGDVTAAGSAEALKVNVGGSGDFRAPRLTSRSAKVSLAGSGSVDTTVVGNAQVSAVGSGRVDLGPRARCQVSRTGSSRVRCGG